ncbi:MAG: TIR domain-containing protein [Enterococcus sp.]|nr:TIR domain-containing protein [Enterococcus sp.]
MIRIKKSTGEAFQVFICYETTTALSFAKNLKESLAKQKYTAFVAAEDTPVGVNHRDYRYSIIRGAPIFILIMTVVGLNSDEVHNEINEAIKYKKQIIPVLSKFFISTANFIK